MTHIWLVCIVHMSGYVSVFETCAAPVSWECALLVLTTCRCEGTQGFSRRCDRNRLDFISFNFPQSFSIFPPLSRKVFFYFARPIFFFFPFSENLWLSAMDGLWHRHCSKWWGQRAWFPVWLSLLWHSKCVSSPGVTPPIHPIGSAPTGLSSVFSIKQLPSFHPCSES